MTTKMGRPPSNNPRTFQAKVRMTQEEHEMLEECSKLLNITKTTVITNGIREVYKKAKK